MQPSSHDAFQEESHSAVSIGGPVSHLFPFKEHTCDTPCRTLHCRSAPLPPHGDEGVLSASVGQLSSVEPALCPDLLELQWCPRSLWPNGASRLGVPWDFSPSSAWVASPSLIPLQICHLFSLDCTQSHAPLSLHSYLLGSGLSGPAAKLLQSLVPWFSPSL